MYYFCLVPFALVMLVLFIAARNTRGIRYTRAFWAGASDVWALAVTVVLSILFSLMSSALDPT
jgi:hypothetical protein